ncbi:microtubule-actin cross-linking factor 1, isoforms 1/2/3/5 [Platysternon megacephalum]|uniref:Microtubule-actin cross-linking factor 1, isoforms 1/2/3/5 n=1 Tax=Platysternon megacephalum TaxID=55544 RepID=A0A4D9EBW5_9SAUR|nr:microtubule-actin cross-linking factor 1, isoforms 1/2/3/5 [Platysternon megacephalum]
MPFHTQNIDTKFGFLKLLLFFLMQTTPLPQILEAPSPNEALPDASIPCCSLCALGFPVDLLAPAAPGPPPNPPARAAASARQYPSVPAVPPHPSCFCSTPCSAAEAKPAPQDPPTTASAPGRHSRPFSAGPQAPRPEQQPSALELDPTAGRVKGPWQLDAVLLPRHPEAGSSSGGSVASRRGPS